MPSTLIAVSRIRWSDLHGQPCFTRSYPGYTYRRRFIWTYPCTQNNSVAFCCSPQTAQSTTPIVSLCMAHAYSRLDYCNATLSGNPPHYHCPCLQSVISASARLIFNLKWRDLVTTCTIFITLCTVDNWSGHRVNFKFTLLVYRCLHGLAPPYLSSSLHREADVDSRWRLRSSADTDTPLIPRGSGWLPMVICCFGCGAARMEQSVGNYSSFSIVAVVI